VCGAVAERSRPPVGARGAKRTGIRHRSRGVGDPPRDPGDTAVGRAAASGGFCAVNPGLSMSVAEPVRRQASARRALPVRPVISIGSLFLLLVASVTAALAIGVGLLPY